MLAFFARAKPVGSTSAALDTQTVTTGGVGTAPAADRARGYASGSWGSIGDGTSDIYGGAAITGLYWDENGGASFYTLSIPGATNSGWSTMTIGSTTLYRTAANFVSGSWTWTTTHTVSQQAFGAAGATRTVTFA